MHIEETAGLYADDGNAPARDGIQETAPIVLSQKESDASAVSSPSIGKSFFWNVICSLCQIFTKICFEKMKRKLSNFLVESTDFIFKVWLTNCIERKA